MKRYVFADQGRLIPDRGSASPTWPSPCSSVAGCGGLVGGRFGRRLPVGYQLGQRMASEDLRTPRTGFSGWQQGTPARQDDAGSREVGAPHYGLGTRAAPALASPSSLCVRSSWAIWRTRSAIEP